jgi:hypothetical protein
MMRKVGTALGPTINPGLLTVTERPRYGGYRRRTAAYLSHPSEPTGPAVASIEIEPSAVVATSAGRARRVFANRLQPVKITAGGTSRSKDTCSGSLSGAYHQEDL